MFYRISFFLLSFHLLLANVSASDQEISFFFPIGSKSAENSDFSTRARSETLTHFDKLLEWFLTPVDINYKLAAPPIAYIFTDISTQLIKFTETYGYFSKERPIIATVSTSKEDLKLTNELFKTIHEEVVDPVRRKIAVGEAISKVLAYRDLKEGDIFFIPTFIIGQSRKLIEYRVDKVFDLWHKMPAFGLVSTSASAPSLLVFRGTDLSLDRRSGWASVISDLDLDGPGYSVYQYAREEITSWLKNIATSHKKACPMGFSLGGVMVMYAALFDADLLDTSSMMAFNPPGVNRELLRKWEDVQESERPHLSIFVNKGDPVSKWGYLIGKTYELTSASVKGPIQAHNVFMNGQKNFEANLVDIEEENLLRGK